LVSCQVHDWDVPDLVCLRVDQQPRVCAPYFLNMLSRGKIRLYGLSPLKLYLFSFAPLYFGILLIFILYDCCFNWLRIVVVVLACSNTILLYA